MRPDTYSLLNAMKSFSSLLIHSGLLAGMGGVCIGVAFAATPTEHKAIVQTGLGGPEVLTLKTVPVPEPGTNQVLIKVYAVAVNPSDIKARTGEDGYAPPAGTSPTSVPGGDVAGVIEKTGSGVTSFKVGDKVFGVVPRVPGKLNGAYAEYAVAPISTVVAKPGNLTYAQASGLGIAGITGVRNVNVTKVSKGQRVLITGAAGGVGSTAVQAAKAKGAYVIGTASARHHTYLRSLGIDEIIDYTKVKFEEQVKDVDAVIDTVGDDDNTAERAMTTLKKGGNYISVGARGLEAKCTAAGIICAGRASAPAVERSIYEETAALAAAGKLKVNIDRTFPLSEAAQAQSTVEQGRTQGKIVLIVNAAEANKQ